MTVTTPLHKWTVGIGAAIALIVVLFMFVPIIDRRPFPATESSAIGRLRNIVMEQREFRSQHGCFASKLPQLPDVTSRDHDYAYAELPEPADEQGCVTKYMITASPVSPHAKGLRYFSIDETETLRSEKTHPPGLSSPVLQ